MRGRVDAPQRRTTQQTVARAERPGTWIALAVLFLAVSAPQWVQGLDGKTLGHVSAAASTVTAALFAVQARRCGRPRRDR